MIFAPPGTASWDSVVDGLQAGIAAQLKWKLLNMDGSASLAAVTGAGITEIDTGVYRRSFPIPAAEGRYQIVWTPPSGSKITETLIVSNDVNQAGVPRALLGANAVATFPVATSGVVELIQGDDYSAADGRALTWTVTGAPSFAGATDVEFTLTGSTGAGGLVRPGAVIGPQQLQVALTASDTGQLQPGSYTFRLEVTLASGRKITAVEGRATVSA